MRIAVTGGAGFVGAHLVGALLGHGHEVCVYDNFFAGHKVEYLPWREQAIVVEGDVLDFDRLNAALQEFQPELLFHLAAIHYIPYCNDHPAETIRVNVEGTANAMRAARQCSGLKGVCFASSAAVYPATAACHKETDPTGPTDIYGLSKVLGEEVVRHYAANSGLAYVLARFFNVFGRDETNPHVIPAVLKQVVAGGKVRMGRTDTYRDFIYVDDLVRALVQIGSLLASEREVAATYNLASGNEYSIAHVVDVMGKTAGIQLEIIAERQHVRLSDRQYLRADISKARRELSWTPEVSLERGLEEIIAAELAPARSGR